MPLHTAQCLWAKTADQQTLCEHMRRSAEQAALLWRGWLAYGVREPLIKTLGAQFAERLFVFLCAAHDLGKATPVFQLRPGVPPALAEAVRDAGLPNARCDASKPPRHELASMLIAERNGMGRTAAIVLGGHHGNTPTKEQAQTRNNAAPFGFESEAWVRVQDALFAYALELAGLTIEEARSVKLSVCAQMLMTGAVTLCDWMASSERPVELPERWTIPESFTGTTFQKRFGFPPNAVQQAAIKAAMDADSPGIFIIEGAMGTGKTEAALALAEILAKKTGRTGVYFALPTRATADGIFERFASWSQKASGGQPHALALAHGKAAFNARYNRLPRFDVHGEDEGEGVFVHSWLMGRRKQLLADFAVGTIDQLLMGALRHKFLALRHLGLAGKVVIIDEAHAYDAYMNVYLQRVLGWLGEYRVPVIVLTATLPSGTRRELAQAYLNAEPDLPETAAYPLITYSNGRQLEKLEPRDGSTEKRVAMVRFDGEIAEKLDELLQNGGCAGVIVNTVKRAQAIAAALMERGQPAMLLHSRFTAADRAGRERKLLERIGKNGRRPERLIVVGTQVLEQSLDIDFDVLLTDICPMDLLIQRIGRLHRHERPRPAGLEIPRCLVMNAKDFDSGSVAVYKAYPLMCTRALLPGEIAIPGDISPLVQAAYGEMTPRDAEREAFSRAKGEYDKFISKKLSAAENFRLRAPTGGKPDLLNALSYPQNRKNGEGEATVRDGMEPVEVILLRQVGDAYRLAAGEGSAIARDRVPDYQLAAAMNGCAVALPRLQGCSDKELFTALEQIKQSAIPKLWEDSHWLRGAYYLPLGEDFATQLCGNRVRYSADLGLVVER